MKLKKQKKNAFETVLFESDCVPHFQPGFYLGVLLKGPVKAKLSVHERMIARVVESIGNWIRTLPAF